MDSAVCLEACIRQHNHQPLCVFVVGRNRAVLLWDESREIGRRARLGPRTLPSFRRGGSMRHGDSATVDVGGLVFTATIQANEAAASQASEPRWEKMPGTIDNRLKEKKKKRTLNNYPIKAKNLQKSGPCNTEEKRKLVKSFVQLQKRQKKHDCMYQGGKTVFRLSLPRGPPPPASKRQQPSSPRHYDFRCLHHNE